MRMRVSRSRPCNLRASSLAGLTRVCTAIRSALVVKLDLASAGVYYNRSPAAAPKLAMLLQGVELFDYFFESRFALSNDARRRILERLLGRNALEPALLCQLFVPRKIESYKQIHLAIGGRCGSWRFGSGGFGFGLGLRFRLFAFWGIGSLLSGFGSAFCFVFSAFKLVQEFFIQPKCLFPAFEFVPRELRLLFISAELKQDICVRHKISLRRGLCQVKTARPGCLPPVSVTFRAYNFRITLNGLGCPRRPAAV